MKCDACGKTITDGEPITAYMLIASPLNDRVYCSPGCANLDVAMNADALRKYFGFHEVVASHKDGVETIETPTRQRQSLSV